MKKKMFTMLLCTVLLINSISGACAAERDTDLTAFEGFYDEKEAEEIMAVVSQSTMFDRSSDLGTKDIEQIKTRDFSVYKVHRVMSADTAAMFREGANLSGMIPEDYYWKAVTPANVFITVMEEKGSWTVVGYGKPSSPDGIPGCVRIESLKTAIDQMDDVSDLMVFEMPLIFTEFALLHASGAEYLIPFGGCPDLTGLKNGKAYSREEVRTTLLANGWGNEIMNDPRENGGILLSGNDTNPDAEVQSRAGGLLIPLCAAAVGAAILTAYTVISQRKTKRQKG